MIGRKQYVAVALVLMVCLFPISALAIRAANPGDPGMNDSSVRDTPATNDVPQQTVRFFSSDRRYVLQLTTDQTQQNTSCTATLQDVSASEAKTRWIATWTDPLDPTMVLVSNRGDYVVMLNHRPAVHPQDRAAVIYGPQGQLIGQLSVGQLLTEKQLQSLSGQVWMKHAYLAQDEAVMVVETMGKEKLVVDLNNAVVKTNGWAVLKSLWLWLVVGVVAVAVAGVIWYRRRLVPSPLSVDEEPPHDLEE